ncbi:MAG: hypothetical protein V1726_02540 [Methanobacteriota archaeon]
MKLWDAYKNQEDELSSHEKKTSMLEERIHEIEQSRNLLEKDLTARITTLTKKLEESERNTAQVNEYKQQMKEFETIRDRLNQEMNLMKTEVQNKDETIACLEKEITNLKQYESYAEYKNKYEAICRDFDKEKERLTKLFRLYEETESECNTVKKEVTEWQNWFNQNEELFNKLFTSAAHLPKNTPETTTPSYTPEQEPETNQTEDEQVKTKKKLRFRI